MRKTIIYFSLLGSLFIFTQTFDWFGTIVMFALFGVVPGVSEPLSANQMLIIYLAVISLLVISYARDWLANISKSFRIGKRSSAS